MQGGWPAGGSIASNWFDAAGTDGQPWPLNAQAQSPTAAPSTPTDKRFESTARRYFLASDPNGTPGATGAFGSIAQVTARRLASLGQQDGTVSRAPSLPFPTVMKEALEVGGVRPEIDAYRCLQGSLAYGPDAITHPNVVTFVELVGVSGNRMALEDVRGGNLLAFNANLRAHLEKSDDPSTRQLVDQVGIPAIMAEAHRLLLHDTLLGLEHIHSRGILHADIKRANVLICADTGAAKVCDLGEGHAFDGPGLQAQQDFTLRHISEASRPLGSPHIRSPEMTNVSHGGPKAPIGTPTDVWSFGLLIHDLTTGDSLIPTDDMTAFRLQIFGKGTPSSQGFVEEMLAKSKGLPGHPEAARLHPLLLNILRAKPEDRPTLAAIAQDPYFTTHSAPPDAVRDIIRHAVAPA